VLKFTVEVARPRKEEIKNDLFGGLGAFPTG